MQIIKGKKDIKELYRLQLLAFESKAAMIGSREAVINIIHAKKRLLYKKIKKHSRYDM